MKVDGQVITMVWGRLNILKQGHEVIYDHLMIIVLSSAMVTIATSPLEWSTFVFNIISIFFFYLLIHHTSCNLSMLPSLDL